jgi:hypothetical protein
MPKPDPKEFNTRFLMYEEIVCKDLGIIDNCPYEQLDEMDISEGTIYFESCTDCGQKRQRFTRYSA